MKSQVRVVGNLALAPVEDRRFTVIDGSAPHKVVAPSRPQLFDPVAYPKAVACSGGKTKDWFMFALAAVLVSVCAAGFMFIGSASNADRVEALMNAPANVVEVVSGDTLWQIASTHPVEGLSINETVDAIKLVNDLDTGLLVPGMELRVPTSIR